jgi:nucleoside-diphosphate-sugar epimerase
LFGQVSIQTGGKVFCSRNILDAAYRYRIRWLTDYSTVGVSGHKQHPPANEHSPISPADDYHFSKHEGKKISRKICTNGSGWVNYTCSNDLRSGRSRPFFNSFSSCNTRLFLMFGDGNAFFHTVHVGNLLDAFELASEMDGASGERYIIAAGKYYSLAEVVNSDAKATRISVRRRRLLNNT